MTGKRVALSIVTLGAIIAGGVVWRSHATAKAAAAASASASAGDRVVPVVVAPVVVKDVPIVMEGLGSVTAFYTVNVKTQVDGPLDKVLFQEGDRVKAGDILAQIDERPFVIAVQQARAQLARDNAILAGDTVDLNRNIDLLKQGLAGQQQVDDSNALVAKDKAVSQGDDVAIRSAQLNLDYTHIKAQISGVTGVRQVDPGNIVHAADAGGIVIITQLDPIAVLFTLPQDDLPRIAAAMHAGELSVDAYSRDGGTKLSTGKLTLVDNQINISTATIRLKAVFPNPDDALWPNQFVKARLQIKVLPQVVTVPAVAVQHGPNGDFVYLLQGDTVDQQPVDVQLTQGDTKVISKGLQAGDKVVTEGMAQLKPGAKVVPRDSTVKPVPSTSSDGGDTPTPSASGKHAHPASSSSGRHKTGPGSL